MDVCLSITQKIPYDLSGLSEVQQANQMISFCGFALEISQVNGKSSTFHLILYSQAMHIFHSIQLSL